MRAPAPELFHRRRQPWDIPDTFVPLCDEFLKGFPKFLDECKRLVTGNRIFQRRTQGVGVMKREDAISWGLSGPTIRGSGVNWDIRKAEPYSGYDTYDFKVPVYDTCDVWARYLVRMEEMEESWKICVEALNRVSAPGEFVANHPKLNCPNAT